MRRQQDAHFVDRHLHLRRLLFLAARRGRAVRPAFGRRRGGCRHRFLRRLLLRRLLLCLLQQRRKRNERQAEAVGEHVGLRVGAAAGRPTDQDERRRQRRLHLGVRVRERVGQEGGKLLVASAEVGALAHGGGVLGDAVAKHAARETHGAELARAPEGSGACAQAATCEGSRTNTFFSSSSHADGRPEDSMEGTQSAQLKAMASLGSWRKFWKKMSFGWIRGRGVEGNHCQETQCLNELCTQLLQRSPNKNSRRGA
eukprot:2009633-Pleurochrysis_carterae.AAC.1